MFRPLRRFGENPAHVPRERYWDAARGGPLQPAKLPDRAQGGFRVLEREFFECQSVGEPALRRAEDLVDLL